MNEKINPLIIRPDGTALDTSTGLVWMVPLVGQGWSNGKPNGNSATLSWGEATSRFGRGRNIFATAVDCHWAVRPSQGHSETSIDRASKNPLSQETYKDYRLGYKRLEFGGFHDWRLPTVEEFWTLSLTEFEGTPLDFEPRRMWTANPSTRSLGGFIMALLDLGACAWQFLLFPGTEVSNGFGDLKTASRYPIRLVRSGTMFDAIH